MAKRKSSTRQESSDYIVREIIAAFLFTVGLFSALSLIFYSGKTGVDVKGAMGSIGVYISGILGMAFGVCAFVVPLVLFYTSVVVFINRAGGNLYRKTASAFLLLVSVMVFLGLLYPNTGLLGFTPRRGVGRRHRRLYNEGQRRRGYRFLSHCNHSPSREFNNNIGDYSLGLTGRARKRFDVYSGEIIRVIEVFRHGIRGIFRISKKIPIQTEDARRS